MASNQQQTILITGVSSWWGERLARRLVTHPEYRVLGLDTELPSAPVPGLHFTQADIRNPLLVELLRAEQVTQVCHLAFRLSERPNEQAFDFNVMGSMKVLGASAAAGVQRILWLSSTAVYGALPKNPAYLTEQHPLEGSKTYGYTRDLVEVEAFCNGFRQQHPQISLTILRAANIIGPRCDTPMTRFLSQPLPPTLLGFDPMMQFIHEDDVVAALEQAVVQPAGGVFNLAAADHLPLSKALGLAGKLPLPVFHMLAYWGRDLTAGNLFGRLSIGLDYLRYRWVADLTRLHSEFGFQASIPAEQALRRYAVERQSGKAVPGSLLRPYDFERFRSLFQEQKERRQQAGRENQSGEAQDV
ncbi:MAG: NAD-dependent epimerase/dehydratase family protein [Anaerolineales bacterium]|nr:NAD-dependent epimerase/dehydratase family protein [Anaerolineales bacterium]